MGAEKRIGSGSDGLALSYERARGKGADVKLARAPGKFPLERSLQLAGKSTPRG
jgi:hypothetical protein